MAECTHPIEKVTFHTMEGDRYPGIWICEGCHTGFNRDPHNRTSVRYLRKANPEHTKEIKFKFPQKY